MRSGFLIALSMSVIAGSALAQVRDGSPSLKIQTKSGVGESARWSKESSVSMKKGGRIFLKTEPVEGADEVRWYQIIPDVSRFYKNANHPWEEDAYKWVGFGEIDYMVNEVEAFRGKWEVEPLSAILYDDAPHYRTDVGSYWFQVEVKKGERVMRSAGIEENDKRNLSPEIARVTVRESDDYLGHLTGFFNVPGVFGSIPYQCENYIGVDCADVLVTARNKWKGAPNKKDFNVDMLVDLWPAVASVDLKNGVPSKEMKWGEDVKRGDLIAVKYEGRSRYQHIGALCGDGDGDGKLSPRDLVIHAGPEALHYSALERGSFDGHVVMLRPK